VWWAFHFCVLLVLLSFVSCKGSSRETTAPAPSVGVASVSQPLPSEAAKKLEALGCLDAKVVQSNVNPQSKRANDELRARGEKVSVLRCKARDRAVRCEALANAYTPFLAKDSTAFRLVVIDESKLLCQRMYRSDGRLLSAAPDRPFVVYPLVVPNAGFARLTSNGGFELELDREQKCALSEGELANDEALRRCVGGLPGIYLRAAPNVRYRTIDRVIQAAGEQSVVSLGPPLGSPHVTCDDEQLAELDMSGDGDPIMVGISPTQLIVGMDDEPLLLVPSSSPERGFDAQYKRCGGDDYFLKPLAERLPEHPKEMRLIVSGALPYRIVWEAHYTMTRRTRALIRVSLMQHVEPAP
jgi:hypothetical protein